MFSFIAARASHGSTRRFWLSVAVLLAITAGGWLLVPRGRITQANFDRIRDGMTEDEVKEILGDPEPLSVVGRGVMRTWTDGPSWIRVVFDDNKFYRKEANFPSAWERLTWYAKKGAAKIGVGKLQPVL